MARTTLADTELSSALRISVMRLARRLRSERSSTADLTLTQISALSTLSRLGPSTPSELAAQERVQPPSMTRVIAALEERGLVTRVPHPTDRRQVLVAATERANAMLLEDRRRREAWLVAHLATLSPDERAVLAAAAPILDRLAAQ
jgi:DNA-binding MarR family transcriptional regulator